MDVATAGGLLRSIARLHTQLQRECVACCAGTTVTECSMLTELGRHGPLTLAELARRLGFDKSWISRAVDGLVAEGVISKTPGTTDRRTILLALSPAGEARYLALHTALNQLAGQVLDHVPATQRALVEQALVLLEQAHLALLTQPEACVLPGSEASACVDSDQCCS